MVQQASAATSVSEEVLSSLGRVESMDTAARAVVELIDSIRRADMADGDRLPNLPELTASLGIARDNVRRALTTLANAGVVQIQVGRQGGTWLRDRTGIPAALAEVLPSHAPDEEWGELVAVRQLLQIEAARLVSQRAEPRCIARIRAHLEEVRSALDSGDIARALFAATDLNCAIAFGCGNRILADMLVRTIDRISVIGYLYTKDLASSPELIHRILTIEQRLVKAIETGDHPRIADAVTSQMNLTLDVLRGHATPAAKRRKPTSGTRARNAPLANSDGTTR